MDENVVDAFWLIASTVIGAAVIIITVVAVCIYAIRKAEKRAEQSARQFALIALTMEMDEAIIALYQTQTSPDEWSIFGYAQWRRSYLQRVSQIGVDTWANCTRHGFLPLMDQYTVKPSDVRHIQTLVINSLPRELRQAV